MGIPALAGVPVFCFIGAMVAGGEAMLVGSHRRDDAT